MVTKPTLNEPTVLAAGDGHRYEFLNNLATVKVIAGEGRSMSVVEFLAPHGFGPPLHRHEDEDELFLIFEGELTFYLGDERIEAGAGACAYLPQAVPHTFQVVSDEARFVNVTASSVTVPRFDLMVAALGSPTERTGLPEPAYIDPAEVAAVCRAHGIAIVGPPPPPID